MAPTAPRECNQPARSVLHRKQSAHRAPCSAAHCIATSSQGIGSRIASRALQRIASHPVQRSAPRECNQPARIGPRIANNPRTNNQPATHRPPRIACRTAHTSHLQLCTRFAVLCAGFVLFVVLTFPKFNLNTLRIAFSSSVRSSVGTELGNLAPCPGFDSGKKISDFFYFRHFLHS
jgi:hypothetical protein